MIAEAEIRRYAARWQVDPMVVDLDYGLGWFLAALMSVGTPASVLRFKGGTCLRKCYFPDYRFSEDLDFTATAYIAPDTLTGWVESAQHWAVEQDGPDFAAAPARLEVVEDEYGSESYQVRVYYRGPLRWGGTPRAIRLDVTREEKLILPAALRPLLHIYSDADALGQIELACYPLEEILAEKIRAVGGQRRFAISRDLYDIHQLVRQGVSVDQAVPLLPAKFAARGIDLKAIRVDQLLGRRAEFEQDWQHRLNYLVPDTPLPVSAASRRRAARRKGVLGTGAVTFADAWQSTLEVVRRVETSVAG